MRRSRYEGERLGPVHVVCTGAQVEAGRRVVDRIGQADVDSAKVVHHRLEAVEVDLDEVVDEDAGRRLQGLPQARRTAVGEGGVEHFGLPRLGLLARVAEPVRLAADDGYQGVTGKADHHAAETASVQMRPKVLTDRCRARFGACWATAHLLLSSVWRTPAPVRCGTAARRWYVRTTHGQPPTAVVHRSSGPRWPGARSG